MADITLASVADVSMPELVEAFNAAYENYYVPIRLSVDEFAAIMERESVDKTQSVVALDSDRIVGLTMLGVRDDMGWVGGVGTLPAYRRQGIARKIMLEVLRRAAKLGLSAAQLEVITLNQGAMALYDSLGFETARELHLLVCEPAARKTLLLSAGMAVEPVDVESGFKLMGELEEVARPWQRQDTSLRWLSDNLRARMAFDEDDRTAGIALETGQGDRGALVALAGSEWAVRQIIGDLFERYPQRTFSFLNVGSDDPALPVLREAGFTEMMSQYEMVCAFG